MKKALLTIIALIITSASFAQIVEEPQPETPQQQPATPIQQPTNPQQQPVAVQPRFGYLNYRAVFEQMPGYAEAQKSLEQIKTKYDAETAHNEENFKRMYLEFLQGQKDFPQTIMLKRQKELQEAMENGVKFRNQVKELLDQAQQDLEKPLLAKLDSAIGLVGKERGYDVIINTSDRTFPFINTITGEDVTELVKQKVAAIKP